MVRRGKGGKGLGKRTYKRKRYKTPHNKLKTHKYKDGNGRFWSIYTRQRTMSPGGYYIKKKNKDGKVRRIAVKGPFTKKHLAFMSLSKPKRKRIMHKFAGRKKRARRS